MGVKKRRYQEKQRILLEREQKRKEVWDTGLRHLLAKYINHPAYLASTRYREELMERALTLNTDEAWTEVQTYSRNMGNELRQTGRFEDYDNWWSEYLDLKEYVSSIY